MSGKLSKGLVQVYTGNGKGKTTAALGLGLRAVGHGLKVYMVQFMKNWNYGEVEGVRRLTPDFMIVQFGRKECITRSDVNELDVKLAKEALKHAEEVIKSGKYDVVILDEVNIAVGWGLLSVNEVLRLIKDKPSNVELVLTGRYAPKELLDAADLVTLFEEVKHPYKEKGITARMGIEY
ncbi:MAG: cob(I)yrinic acid a,c-diamide adenosyltransferase [Candidatus Nezhaarchaeales archaeon]